ncbi:uncharacterized protein LOC132750325 [Ruditapes philippinarum]|uniref:uncharacterized protein LOC132750325 n=1 Tax=Ruditapes philippinarum TaxID=129788 RepID=UPI00295BC012|nr:uncharacterized protein LOC132750325 [Ruditapes philippinarum]
MPNQNQIKVMWMVRLLGAVLITQTFEVSGKVSRYTLDQQNICQSANVFTPPWLLENDVVLINAKSSVERNRLFPECVIKLGPDPDSTKKTVKLKIESFYITSCGVYLAVEQSPRTFFDTDVSTLFNFSCHTKPASNLEYHGDANNNIKIFLLKENRHLLDYNFILNVTLVDHEEVAAGISSAVVIGICVVAAIFLIGAACISYRCLMIKRFSKQQFETDHVFRQSNLAHQIQDLPLGSTRYSNLPLGEIDQTGSVHSQTCIVGTLGTDGLCTVCHRNHDDFAHVVDIGPNGEIIESHDSHSHPHHQTSHIRSSDRDIVIRPDSRTSTPRTRHVHNVNLGAHRHNSPLSDSTSRLAPQIRASGLSSSGELMVDDDDDIDIDVSGNDLIPPSYDLSPPSYDEAVNMPKPEEELQRPIAGFKFKFNFRNRSPLFKNFLKLFKPKRC